MMMTSVMYWKVLREIGFIQNWGRYIVTDNGLLLKTAAWEKLSAIPGKCMDIRVPGCGAQTHLENWNGKEWATLTRWWLIGCSKKLLLASHRVAKVENRVLLEYWIKGLENELYKACISLLNWRIATVKLTVKRKE